MDGQVQQPYPQQPTPFVPHARRKLVWVVGALVVAIGALAFLASRRAESGGAMLWVRPPATAVDAGQSFTLDVVLDAQDYRPTAADIVIAYDPQLLRAVAVRPGELLPVALVPASLDEGRATITVASGTAPAASGQGIIVRVDFLALRTGVAQVALAGGTQAAAAGQAGDIITQLRHAQVTVR
jgi:hypothetical protein